MLVGTSWLEVDEEDNSKRMIDVETGNFTFRIEIGFNYNQVNYHAKLFFSLDLHWSFRQVDGYFQSTQSQGTRITSVSLSHSRLIPRTQSGELSWDYHKSRRNKIKKLRFSSVFVLLPVFLRNSHQNVVTVIGNKLSHNKYCYTCAVIRIFWCLINKNELDSETLIREWSNMVQNVCKSTEALLTETIAAILQVRTSLKVILTTQAKWS